jgi:hypothetical protein
MARSVVILYRLDCADPGAFHHLPTAIKPRVGNEEPKLAMWGLIEEERVLRADGGRAGYWRLTPDGVAWARGEIKVPYYIVLLNGVMDEDSPTSLSKTGILKPDITIFDALGTEFNYRKLLDGEA